MTSKKRVCIYKTNPSNFITPTRQGALQNKGKHMLSLVDICVLNTLFCYLQLLLLCNSCLCCCQTCNRYTEWRTGYIVKTNLVAEFYRRWISTMLTTDTAVKFAVCRFSKFQSCFHQLTNTILVKFSKWIVLEDLSIILSIEELTSIVT